jgi:hypothetical protein
MFRPRCCALVATARPEASHAVRTIPLNGAPSMALIGRARHAPGRRQNEVDSARRRLADHGYEMPRGVVRCAVEEATCELKAVIMRADADRTLEEGRGSSGRRSRSSSFHGCVPSGFQAVTVIPGERAHPPRR